MSENTISILDPESSPFSDRIINHLNNTSEKIGSCLVFWDMNDVLEVFGQIVSADAKAAVITPQTEPWFAFVINPAHMSTKNYKAKKHDPLLAHEAEHAQLHSEGYLHISYHNQPDEIRWAISAINNWLDGPIINIRLERSGFNIRSDRIYEILDTINTLKTKGWPRNQKQRTLRIGASFLSEPNIPSDLLKQFEILLESSLGGKQFNRIRTIVHLISQAENKDHNTYNSTGEEILNILSLWFNFKFSPIVREHFSSFSESEVATWAADNISQIKKMALI